MADANPANKPATKKVAKKATPKSNVLKDNQRVHETVNSAGKTSKMVVTKY